MLGTIQYIGLFSLYIFSFYQSKAALFYVTSSTVTFDRLYVEDINITINPDKLSVNIVYILAQDQPSDPYFDIIIDMKNRRNKVFRQLYRHKPTNFCQLSQYSNWVNGFLINLFKSGGMDPDNCPLKKGTYTWTNVSAKSINVPDFAVALYRASFIVSLRGGAQNVSYALVHFQVK